MKKCQNLHKNSVGCWSDITFCGSDARDRVGSPYASNGLRTPPISFNISAGPALAPTTIVTRRTSSF